MKIACIPDTHFPFCDDSKLEKAKAIIKNFKPQVIIQLGDLYDQWSFSKYPKNLSAVGVTPLEEAKNGRFLAENMWSDLRKQNPGAKLFQISDGNHDVRILKHLAEKSSAAAFIADEWLEKQMRFDGVQTIESEFVIDNIMFMHGMRKAGDHGRYNQMSTVTGHTHKARIEYMSNINGPFFEMNCGWLGNKKSKVFSYGSYQKVIISTHTGIGLIEDRQPRFVSI